jgi:hypothetical protein
MLTLLPEFDSADHGSTQVVLPNFWSQFQRPDQAGLPVPIHLEETPQNKVLSLI